MHTDPNIVRLRAVVAAESLPRGALRELMGPP